MVGLKGELAIEEAEDAEVARAREARRQERKDAIERRRQQRREEARSAMEEEGERPRAAPGWSQSAMVDVVVVGGVVIIAVVVGVVGVAVVDVGVVGDVSCCCSCYYLWGTIVNRTYGTHKKLYIFIFLPSIFGSIYHGPP